MKKESPRVGAVIVNWNTREYLLRALHSFVNDDVPESNIVVADQGSTDGSMAAVRRRYPRVKIVSRPSNDSYASAVNAGAARLAVDYLVVVNADIEFGNGSLKSLSEILERDETVAIVGPALVDANDAPATRFSRTGALRAVGLVLFPSFIRGSWRRIERSVYGTERPETVRFVGGCFMFVRRTAFDEIGGFDETFTFYFEDADFCLRLRKLGYKLVHSPYATVTHIGGASFGREPDKSSIEFYRGCLLFYRLHLYRRYVWLKRGLRVAVFFRELLEHIRFGKAGRWRTLRTLLGSEREIHTHSPRSPRPFVSVIVPTFERVDCLISTLTGLLRQSYRNFEVIVVDQSRTKDARKERFYRRAGKRLAVLRPSRANRSFAKNVGAYEARGEILLFCDDDISVPDD
ncbi:MAG TPA: glycosyltransferase family 2 protein, partial [Bacteroidota bacterium]|nr:glycosyltransferase family 2 protein [Bacteroidota bacterium]